MTIPKEFNLLCSSLVFGMKYGGDTPQDWIRYALKQLRTEQKNIALRTVDEVLSDKFDFAEVQRMWDELLNDAGIQMVGDLRAYLGLVRDQSLQP